jgi:hypothetical protein
VRLRFSTGLRRLLPASRIALGGKRRSTAPASSQVESEREDRWDAELEDFLAADLDSLPLDPPWKDVLRNRLWELCESRRRGSPDFLAATAREKAEA